MDKALRRVLIILLLTVGLAVHAQILAPILMTQPVISAGSNIAFQNFAGIGTNAGATTATLAYTCTSTTDRLILEVDTNGTTASLSDTGGLAASATLLGSGVADSDLIKGWNMGCASGPNSISANVTGGGGTQTIFLGLLEYSGIGTTGTLTLTGGSSGTSCSTSATAASSGYLAVGLVGSGPGMYSYQINQPSAFTFRGQWNVNVVEPYQSAYEFFYDNLNSPSGTVTFSAAFPSQGYRCTEILVPGLSATSPNFYPTVAQAITGTPSSGFSYSFNYNVTAGDTIAFAWGYAGTTAPTSVTGTNDGGWTLQKSEANGVTCGSGCIVYVGLWIYTAKATATGTETVTVTASGANYPVGILNEFTGLTGTVTDTGGAVPTGSSPVTWTQTVTNNNSVIFAVGLSASANVSYSISNLGFSPTSGTGGIQESGIGYWSRALTAGSQTISIGIPTTFSANVGASIVLQ